MPVLAKEAIKGAGLIENSQVLEAIFRPLTVGKFWITSPGAAGTNPISHAVGGQGIVIPADVAPLRGSTHQSIFSVEAKPTVAPTSWWNVALVDTKLTFDSPFCPWRLFRKMKWLSCRTVSFLNQREKAGKILSNAINA